MRTQSDLTKQILNLLERDMKPRVICKILKCSANQVYQIKYNYKKDIKKAKAKAKVAARVVPPSTTPPLVSKKGLPPPRLDLNNLKVGMEIGGLVLTEPSSGLYRWTRKGHEKNVLPKPTPKTPDVVNHPAHYTDGGIEVIDFIEAKGLGYRLGNVVKYVSRAKLKGNPLEDLRKAEWYLKREIEARTNA